MLKAIKIRIYPNKEQEVYLGKLFGTCRFVYNKALEYKKSNYDKDKTSISLSGLSKYVTELKSTEEYSWINNVHSVPVQQSLIDLDKSYTNFFKHGFGFPTFKNRNSKQSVRFNNQLGKNFIQGNKVKLNKHLSNIRFRCSKEDEKYLNKSNLDYKSATLSKSKSGKYFLSILVERGLTRNVPKTTNIVGIDLGIKDFLITSEGEVFENKKFIRNNQNKLSKLQKGLSKKTKGSNRYNKHRVKIARLHEKLTNQKRDYLHKVTNSLINDNQVIAMEDLNVKGMISNHKLARSIQELSLHEFKSILTYKCKWYDRDLVQVGRFFASSKTCSNCGNKKDDLTLKDRVYSCDDCGHEMDRDLNAAINIKQEGIKILATGTVVNARGGKVRPKKPKVSKAVPMKRETTQL